jgi:CheY-like chemotaxis protein
MPACRGWTALPPQALRENSTTYIIGVSADAMTEGEDAALAAGMDDYLPKPISQVALAAAIEGWRQRMVAMRQLEQRRDGDKM